MQGDTCPTEWHMSTVIPQNCACVKQVLIGWKLIFWYKVQWQQIHRTVEQFSTNQMLGDILYPGFWLVENCSTVRCICCHWTLIPKINFQTIRTCLTHTQFCGMTVGHVSFIGHVLPCIVCLPKYWNLPHLNEECSHIFYTFLVSLPEMKGKSPWYSFETYDVW